MYENLIRRRPHLAHVVRPWPTSKPAVSGPPCPATTPERDRYGMQEVADICGRRSRGWAIKQVRLGRLRAVRDGRKFVVRRADLDAFLASAEEV